MPYYSSPLRYPGGKGGLARFLAELLARNGIKDGIYAEPYAGGAGAALSLLLSERVSRILINDLDPCVFALWWAMLNQSTRFLRLLDETPVTIAEWRRQRKIYLHPDRHSRVRLGFATFFLNRTNRSGIIMNGGPVGGYNQNGKWKLDARYNKEDLRKRVETIVAYKDRILVTNLDACEFLDEVVCPLASRFPTFAYLDPPYFAKGGLLYLNAYRPADHRAVANYLRDRRDFKWVLSYDDVPQIRELYSAFRQVPFSLAYTAHKRSSGNELLIYRPDLQVPTDIEDWVFRRRVA